MSESGYKDFEWENSLELKKALKLVLKYEIHCLLRRLSETGEESVVITASAAEGSASHLCSKKGEDFLQIENLEAVKHNFLSYCKVVSEPSLSKRPRLETFTPPSRAAPKEQSEVSPREQSSEEITIIEPVSIKSEPVDLDLDLDLQVSELTECPQPQEQKNMPSVSHESSQAHRVLMSKFNREKDPGKRMNESSNTLSNYYEHMLSKLNREINNEINKTMDREIRMDVFSSGSASNVTGTRGMLVESSSADFHTAPRPQGVEKGLEAPEKEDTFNEGIKGAFKDGVLKLETNPHPEFVENTCVWEHSLPMPEKESRPTAYCMKAAETGSVGEYRQFLPFPQTTSEHVTFSSSTDPDEAGRPRMEKNVCNNAFYYTSDMNYRSREVQNHFIGSLPFVQSVNFDNLRAVNARSEGIAESPLIHIEDTNYVCGDMVYTEMTSFASVGVTAMKCLICNKHLSRSRPYYRRRHWIHHMRERAVMVEKTNSPQRK